VLLDPLPLPNADRLVHIGGTAPGTDQPEEFGVPDELYFEYRGSMFLWQGTRMTLLGVLVGVLAAVGFTRSVRTLLYGVQRLDVTAFAGMSAVMVAVALLASYIPARRVSRVDPLVALRGE
jgi:hypothetical protein